MQSAAFRKSKGAISAVPHEPNHQITDFLSKLSDRNSDQTTTETIDITPYNKTQPKKRKMKPAHCCPSSTTHPRATPTPDPTTPPPPRRRHRHSSSSTERRHPWAPSSTPRRSPGCPSPTPTRRSRRRPAAEQAGNGCGSCSPPPEKSASPAGSGGAAPNWRGFEFQILVEMKKARSDGGDWVCDPTVTNDGIFLFLFEILIELFTRQGRS